MVKKIFYRLILSLPVLIGLSLGVGQAATLYVTNYGNNTIEQFDTSGTPMFFASTAPFPSGLAVDVAGNHVATSGGAVWSSRRRAWTWAFSPPC